MKKLLAYIFDAGSMTSRMVCALTYILVYDYAYKDFVYKLFSYMDIDYIDMSVGRFMTWVVLSVVPMLFYRGIRNVSSFFTIFLYVLVYIPFVHALFTMWNLDGFSMASYGIVLCVLFVLYFSIGEENTILKDLVIRPQILFRCV